MEASSTLQETVSSMLPGSEHVLYSTAARLLSGGSSHKRDVVLLNYQYGFAAAEVWLHLDMDPGHSKASGLLSIVVIHHRLSIDPHGKSGKYNVAHEEPQLIPTASILCAAIARWSDDVLTVLWPLEYNRM